MTKLYDVAVVGATGVVGETMLSILAERKFTVRDVYPVASSRSAGSLLPFGDKELVVQYLEKFDLSKVQLGLFSPGASVSAIYAPKSAAAGCLVIDHTPEFSYE